MTDPILLDIAGAVAARSTPALVELVSRKFDKDPYQRTVLSAANNQEPATVRRLAGQLAAAEYEDEEFGRQLRAEWSTLRTQTRTTTNMVRGTVFGSVIQAGDVSGSITIGDNNAIALGDNNNIGARRRGIDNPRSTS